MLDDYDYGEDDGEIEHEEWETEVAELDETDADRGGVEEDEDTEE